MRIYTLYYENRFDEFLETRIFVQKYIELRHILSKILVNEFRTDKFFFFCQFNVLYNDLQ